MWTIIKELTKTAENLKMIILGHDIIEIEKKWE